ncbi:hypothetical protein [Furfurilactobacillus curtus]|uniref:DUF302 domain-containing protein n=1 Tax=Furfurilactobacillus curtus TaxID=1746200 RepID=A0ABQ5JPR1_9LACO
MDIQVADFLTAIKDETYAAYADTATFAQLNDTPTEVMQASFDFALKQLQAGKLFQARVDVTGFHDVEINVRLESSVINLPFAYVNEIDKMLDADAVLPVNVYMIFDSPAINVSKMRIDMASSVQAFLDDNESVTEKVIDWLREQVERLTIAEADDEEQTD